MTTASLSTSPTPTTTAPSATGRGTARSGTWTLTRWMLRYLAPAQIYAQGIGIAAVTTIALLIRSQAPTIVVNDKTIAVTVVGGYVITALWVGLILNIVHGVVMAVRTPILLRAGATRTTLLTSHALTATLLGSALVVLVAVLSAADLVASHSVEAMSTPVLIWGVPAALLTALLGYVIGLSIGMLFLSWHWIAAVAALLLTLNLASSTAAVAAFQWGRPTGVACAVLTASLVILAGPVTATALLRRFQPRR